MVRTFADRIWFAHLCLTQREADGESFFEATQLDGDDNLVDIVMALVQEEWQRRRKAMRGRFRFVQTMGSSY